MSEDDMPPNVPMTILDSARALHEWYISMREVGFTESEAIAIIGQAIRPEKP